MTYLDILAINPTASVNLEKIPLPPAQSLTAQELEQIWAATEYLGETQQQQRDLALLHILSHGLRAGEIVSLNVGAFRWQANFCGRHEDKRTAISATAKTESRGTQGVFIESRRTGRGSIERSPLVYLSR